MKVECEHCLSLYDPPKDWSRFCGQACADASHPSDAPIVKVCAWKFCNETFEAVRQNHKFHDRRCQAKDRNERKNESRRAGNDSSVQRITDSQRLVMAKSNQIDVVAEMREERLEGMAEAERYRQLSWDRNMIRRY